MVLFVKDKTLVAIRSKVQVIVVTCAPNHGTIVLWMNSLGPCAMSLHHQGRAGPWPPNVGVTTHKIP